ncbi:MAG: FAD-binding domain-containing protein [Opitutaceae bacterium]
MPDFVPTREAGLSRLHAFVPRALRYAEERDFDRPGQPSVSRLSPWLQRRLVTEAETCEAVRTAHPWSRAEKYIQEVCWRTYWKGWLEHRPEVWRRYGDAVRRLRESPPPGYVEAIEGRTGLPGFDDWAHELVRTGWLHNHARMWFASIWIFTLRLPWELGAEFFWRHLLDGDAAANTLSWRWVAGLHTPGKTYLARADTIARFTDGRFNPVGKLALEAVPLVEPPLGAPVEPWYPPATRNPPVGPVGLWLHPEDLCVESANLGEVTPVGVLALWSESLAVKQAWADPVVSFTQAALADGASRAAVAWSADLRVVRADDPGPAVVDWARSLGLRTVIALRPAVGPWLDAGLAVEAELDRAGIALRWYRRDWDTLLYPAAKRGFFPFWDVAARLHLPVDHGATGAAARPAAGRLSGQEAGVVEKK